MDVVTKHCDVTELTQERNVATIRGLYDVIFNKLDIETATKILAEQGRICADVFITQLPPGSLKDFDSFLNAASNLGKKKVEGMAPELQRKRTVVREGNTIYWTLDNDGKCICHLLRAGFVNQHARLGICCANWVKRQVERFSDGMPVTVELLNDPLQGAKECKFKCTIAGDEKNPVFDSKTGTFVERHQP
jgi:hypothetical protein